MYSYLYLPVLHVNSLCVHLCYGLCHRRTAMRTDTCSIVAISINIQQKVHPVIWSQSDLPYDCFLSVPMPKPIGEHRVWLVIV